VSAVISVFEVSKTFRLYHERAYSVKERFVNRRKTRFEQFWALRDVSISVDEGDTAGLIGPNGSGKTTLLKLVGGIIRPTSGRIVTRGRIASLLELGAGFHPDLTGRQNVYLNASILGLSKKETDRHFDAIVAFSELEKFIDMQVRHYSSGMYVRLGFAVAVHVDPQILIVDEVLSVGDEAFQRKCLERIRTFQREGITIVFVTHAVDTVRLNSN
jgi:ABC-2 type transport system ATP-binding protein